MLSGLLVVLALVPFAPAQAASSIVISRGSVIGGESITVSGALGQRKARPVVLQRQSGTRWVNVVTSRSAANGTFRFLFKPPTKIGSKTVVRVLAPKTKIGSKNYAQITTGGRSVLTIGQTAAISGVNNVAQDTAFTIDGKFTPARPGRTVVVQKPFNGSWVSIGKQSAESAAGTVSILMSLASSGSFEFRLIALAADGAPAVASASKTITVFLPAPSGLIAAPGNASAHLSWNAVNASGVVGYNVYQRTDPNAPPTKVNSTPVNGTSFDVGGLTNGVKYYFSVTSANGSGDESANSAAVSTTPVQPADTTPPPVPAGVTAEAGEASAQVSWTAVSASDLAGYNVYRATASAPSTWTKLTPSAISATTFGATGLTNGTAYIFSVTSVDTHANESLKSTSSAAVTPQPGADTTAPPVPTGVGATAGTTSAQVTWTAVSAPDLAGYLVYRGTSAAGPWTKLTPNAISPTAFGATGLTNGTQYFFAVSSIDNSGNESALSAPASATPVAPPAGWAAVSAGEQHTCAVGSNGTLWCWGLNRNGQLGNATGLETGNAYATPIRVGGATTWTSVSAGDDFTCGIQSPGTLWCWGVNTYGQLGSTTGSADANPVPLQVGSGTNWVSVSTAANHTCALASGGTVWCWGLNTDGQLGRAAGINTLDPNPTPVQVGSGATWASISAGEDHTCATQTDHTVWCWGSNLYGQLGNSTTDGTTTPTSVPTKVGTATNWATVSAGDYGSCGVLTTGGLQCWGRNQYGQLASAVDGNDGPHATPATVTGGTVWAQVSVGGGQVCAVRTDKTAYCWGRRDFGQVGSTSATPLTTPTKVGTATNWVTIDAGNGIDDSSGHTAGINNLGKIFTWGANQYGELGRAGGDPSTVGTTNPSPTPGEVPVPVG